MDVNRIHPCEEISQLAKGLSEKADALSKRLHHVDDTLAGSINLTRGTLELIRLVKRDPNGMDLPALLEVLGESLGRVQDDMLIARSTLDPSQTD